MVSKCHIDTPIGNAMAAACENGLVGFWFEGQKYYPRDAEQWQQDAGLPVFCALREWLAGYFAGRREGPSFQLTPRGTPFRQQVWAKLLQIPYGETTTYGAIAAQMAAERGLASMSAQAVGGAVGHNPISVLIPCHRVLGAAGQLTGYAGGVDKKLALLTLEKALPL